MKIAFYILISAVFHFKASNAEDVVFYRYWAECNPECTEEEGRFLFTIAIDEEQEKVYLHDDFWFSYECAVKGNWCTARRQYINFGSEEAGCKCNPGKLIFTPMDSSISRYFHKNFLRQEEIILQFFLFCIF